MSTVDMICYGLTDMIPLLAAGGSFIYGIRRFFKKGKPLFLQSLTMAMGCHALGSLYHICQSLTRMTVPEGFTPAYLGHIGFFLFLLTASYGQMDRIIDDGTPPMRPARWLALLAPLAAVLLYLPNGLVAEVSVATKVTYLLVWIPACVSVYFSLKHTIIPDMDFGFIKAIKPYNLMALILSFGELLMMTAWDFLSPVPMAMSALFFGVFCVATVITAERGVRKWII